MEKTKIINELKKKYNMSSESLSELSHRTGITKETAKNILSGKTNPSHVTISKLSVVLNVEPGNYCVNCTDFVPGFRYRYNKMRPLECYEFINDFRDQIELQNISLKLFYTIYLKHKKINYNNFIIQINFNSPLSSEVKTAIGFFVNKIDKNNR